MPTQENLGELPSGSGTKAENQSATSGSEALAVESPNMSDMPPPSDGEMTKDEALAVAWTGIEALALAGAAVIYQSLESGETWIRLLATCYDTANGLRSVGK